MANYFNLEKDTTAPAGVTISLAGGAQYATNQVIEATIGTSDEVTTGYQMKIWGDIDGTYDTDVQPLEADSNWISYATAKNIKLSATDGSKTVYLKVRDDVYNPCTEVSDTIILDTTLPVVNITGPDLSKISKQATKNVSSFSFTVDSIFDEYKVKVVSSSGAAHDTGDLIPTAGGSTNMSGSAGSYPASTPINCQINCIDLESASAADGVKIIKVFVKDTAGNWSV